MTDEIPTCVHCGATADETEIYDTFIDGQVTCLETGCLAEVGQACLTDQLEWKGEEDSEDEDNE